MCCGAYALRPLLCLAAYGASPLETDMSLVKLNRHNRYAYSPITERPAFTWPGDKRLALSICNNIEVFSFLSGLGSDSATLTAP
jgi:hypothetical protein